MKEYLQLMREKHRELVKEDEIADAFSVFDVVRFFYAFSVFDVVRKIIILDCRELVLMMIMTLWLFRMGTVI